MKTNIKILLSYEGTHYLGWQKTPMGPSIEEALERAASQLLREPLSLQAASRTDAGVHAAGQVVNFFSEKSALDIYRLHNGLNALLPKDISVKKTEKASEGFHPTLDAAGKEYHYSLCTAPAQLPFHRRFSWHCPYPLSLELMRSAADQLIGLHDFSAFCNEQTLIKGDKTREIFSIEILSLPEGRIRICVKGNHFLYKMVRNIVGTLVYIGRGKIPLEALPAILASRDRKQAGVTAPAHGLTLWQVFYGP